MQTQPPRMPVDTLDFVKVTEAAALAASRWMGRGERDIADGAAVEAMRDTLNQMDIDGRIVIGEGERDEAPMLFIGEELGRGGFAVDIAVDPVEGTNLVANGLPNSISVMAASRRRPDGPPAMRSIPSFYSMKLAFGPAVVRALVDGLTPFALDDPLESVLRRVAEGLGKRVGDVVVVMLNRPRHAEFIAEVRRVRLVGRDQSGVT